MRTLTVKSIVLASILLSLLPVFFYAAWFHPLPVGQTPTEWGAFASYVSGLASPLLSIVSLGLVAHIAINIQQATQSKQEHYEKTKRLFEMHREWTDPLYEARTDANMLLLKFPYETAVGIEMRHPEESKSLWRVVGFFQAMEFAVSKELIDEREAVDLFGQIFIWWQVVGIKGDYPSEWDSFMRITSFRNRVNGLMEPTTLANWVKYADDDLKARQAAGGSKG
ncbi:hypothetical protein [Acidipila sp. EB88]|uniref:hypothetical protein n=1 Tax=Acidipila sp. EB88 TaxID=2305226 RepID=UPI000F5E8AFD|nr:hypothetical protein [Acidipila sp. EB88]